MIFNRSCHCQWYLPYNSLWQSSNISWVYFETRLNSQKVNLAMKLCFFFLNKDL
jgi:hypothetical protein